MGPHKVTVDLQRALVFVVDKNTNRQTKYLFRFKHASKALLDQRPNKVVFRVVDVDFFNRLALGFLPDLHTYFEQLGNMLLISF